LSRLPRVRVLGTVAAFATLALCGALCGALSGCNAGGLLEVQATGSGGSPAALGPNVTEIVNGGTVAANAKYKVVYTLGQPTPNQGPTKGPNNRDNGGLVGAMNGR
jgi:hypothetical protein